MCTKLFHRLPYLLCLFKISCFFALQRIPLHSSSFSSCSDKHKKIEVICNIHSEELQIEPKNFGNELLVYGFIREFEPKVANKIIPDCIMNLCVDFSRRMLPCDCIKGKYRKILPNKDLKKALIFFLMYKIEDVRDQKYNLERTILHYACGNGNLGLAKLLRKWGTNISVKTANGSNALHWACYSGSVAIATWLLDECKIDLEAKGDAQMTCFLFAAQNGHLEIVMLLKDQGANLNAKSKYGNNALHYACDSSESVEMVTWLLDTCKLGIETKGRYQKTPFLCAAEKGQLEIAKLLKKRSVNLNAKDEHGYNALHYACASSGSIPMVTWLLDECKMGLETRGQNQATPFLCAAGSGNLEIAKLLKDRGANVNVRDKDGDNALHLICLFSGSVEMTTWLLDKCKVPIETRGKNQTTPFLFAAEKGQLEIAKLLRQRGANINAKNEYGNNALQLATMFSKNKEMIRYLESQSRIKTGRRFNFWSRWF